MSKTPAPRALFSLAALLAVSLFAAAEAEAASLTRQPYLQSTTQTSTQLAFRTDADCPSVVRYGPTGTEQATEQPAGTRHLHTLSNLEPATAYRYQVEACGQVLASGKRFVTAGPSEAQSVHFAVVGDNGTGAARQIEVANSILAARPELTVTVGDNAYSSGTEEEHQTNLFDPMAGLLSEIPLFASPGNHEYETDNAAPYLDNFHLPANNPSASERYYSFDWGFAHFVSLDSMCGRGTETLDCTGEALTQWLENDLATTQQPWKIVFFHHPPYSSGEHGSAADLQETWAPIFERYGVDLVLTGHDHNYERSHPMKAGQVVGAGEGGIPYLVVGSGGAQLRDWSTGQPSWSAVRNNTDYGFLDVKIEGGTLSANFVTPSGAVADSFELTKEVPPPALSAPTPAETTEPELPTRTAAPSFPLTTEAPTPGKASAGGCAAGGALAGTFALSLAPLAVTLLGLRRRRALRQRPGTQHAS